MDEPTAPTNEVKAKDRPGVIAPPPLIYIGFLVLAYVLGFFWPLAMGFGDWRYPAAALMFVGGGIIAIAAIRQFKAVGTNFDVYKPATTVVATGVYRYSRNPMYVGLTLAYLSIAVAIDSGWALLLAVPTLAVMHYGVIRREEGYLAAKFGEPYNAFRAKVRRWI